MRIFLTGATGYVGAAALGAFVRHGHDVTALVRHPGQGRAPRERRRDDDRGRREQARLLRGCRADVRRAGAHGVRSIRARAADGRRGRGGDAGRGARPATAGPAGHASSTRRARGCSGTSRTAPPRTRRCGRRRSWRGAWRTEQALSSDARAAGVRAVIVRPGIVYGGAEGLVGELLKNAANGLIRVVGDGTNRWPCVYDRDLADLYAAAGGPPRRRGGVPRHRPRRRAGAGHRGRHLAPHAAAARRAPCAAARGPRQAGPVCRRAGARSGGAQPARARARDGRRRCTRSPAAWRACWKSSGPPAKPPDAGEAAPGWLTSQSSSRSSSVGARQKIEERVEAAVERAAQLRDGAVDRVQRHLGRLATGEVEPRILRVLQRAFRDEPNAVDQRVPSHGSL